MEETPPPNYATGTEYITIYSKIYVYYIKFG